LPATLALLVMAVVLAACSSAATAVPSPSAPPASIAAASASPSASAAASDPGLVLGNCPSTAPSGSTPPCPVPGSSTEPSAAAATPQASAFPASITDDEGTAVTIPARPSRIVSLSPAVTETLFAIGAGDRLVGRGESDDYPAEAKAVPAVATFTGVELEKVVAQKPDLVIAGGNGLTPPADIQSLRRLGLPVVVVYAKSVEGVLDDIRLVGRASGDEAAATALAAQLQARIDAISAAAAAAGDAPRTFYEIDATKEIYGPAPESFLAQMIQLAGGKAVTTDSPSVWSISLEKLLQADPQVIVLGDANYGVTPDNVKARSGWAGMAAVGHDAIRPVNDTIVTRPGPRIADGLAALALAIHPGLVLPVAAAPSASPTAWLVTRTGRIAA
jgi:iron complex transport system substrate-binding protein